MSRYEKELEVVGWYIRVFEDGLDSRQIMQLYYEEKKEHQRLKEKTEKQIAKLTKKNKK